MHSATAIVSAATDNPAARALGTVVVQVPPAGADTLSSWARLVTAVGPGEGTTALTGTWLTPDSLAVLPTGALLLTADQHPGRQWRITLLRADPDAENGLDVLKRWARRTPPGRQQLAAVRTHLAADAADHTVGATITANRHPGRCHRCTRQIPARAGWLHHHGPGRHTLTHRPGDCPPPAETVEPNAYPGRCLLCEGWVDAGEGRAVLVDRTPAPLTRTPQARRARYAPEHRTCPEAPAPGPLTTDDRWCVDCRRRIHPGHGHRLPDGTHRHTTCPAHDPGPLWLIHRPATAPLATGTTTVVRLRPRPGEPPVPEHAPGARTLDETGFAELIATVEDATDPDADGRTLALLRPATWDEAIPLLVERAELDLDAAPAASTFRAVWQRERICGDAPWLAEITGHHPLYGLRRTFMSAQRDYDALQDRYGWRGVHYLWTLRTNRVYEAGWPVDPVDPAWRGIRRTGVRTRVTAQERAFLRVTAQGDIEQISREQAQAWLRNAAGTAAAELER
ncbi:hypothetical protein ACIQF6_28380 [Kitasatospora sp. NPDC092948]|uniref:hypothetical protein n=1 Tax=Kitasatospora sp. NPDC092948 TaxID=3364088 RepID=UPI00382F24DC